MPLARSLLLVLLLVAGGVAGCASLGARRQRPEETFRVSGYVRDSVSGKPVAGVFVNTQDLRNVPGISFTQCPADR